MPEEILEFEVEKKKLMALVFEKGKKDSKQSSKHPIAKYIEQVTDGKLKEKTLVRAFDRYVFGDDSQSVLSFYNLNNAAKYLGYDSFGDFCQDNFPETEREPTKVEKDGRNPIEFQKKKLLSFTKGIWGIGTLAVLGIGGVTFSHFNQAECMYWEKSRYEKIDCSEKIHPQTSVLPYDAQLFKYFFKIEPTDTTTYFKTGKAVVWYAKTEGEIEFFSTQGNHPKTGKQLKPITPYIVQKYVVAVQNE